MNAIPTFRWLLIFIVGLSLVGCSPRAIIVSPDVLTLEECIPDEGKCSLHGAVKYANSTSGAQIILLEPGRYVSRTSLKISDSVTIGSTSFKFPPDVHVVSDNNFVLPIFTIATSSTETASVDTPGHFQLPRRRRFPAPDRGMTLRVENIRVSGQMLAFYVDHPHFLDLFQVVIENIGELIQFTSERCHAAAILNVGGDVTIRNSTLRGPTNDCASLIWNSGSSPWPYSPPVAGIMEIVNSTIGPGVTTEQLIFNTDSMLIRNSTISGNEVNRALIESNRVVNDAGVSITSEVAIENSTITDNIHGRRGLEVSPQTTVKNSIISGNSGNALSVSECGRPDRQNGPTSLGFNVLGEKCFLFRDTGSLGNTVTDNPRLLPLSDNGGGNDTHLPLIGLSPPFARPPSPALNGGAPASAPRAIRCADRDQRDRDRSEPCDIGAVELHPDDLN